MDEHCIFAASYLTSKSVSCCSPYLSCYPFFHAENFTIFAPEKRTRMTPEENDILLLRDMVEKSVARKMKSPADFFFLTGVIQERCHETLAVSTL